MHSRQVGLFIQSRQLKILFPVIQKKKNYRFQKFSSVCIYVHFGLFVGVMNVTNDISKITSLRDTAICKLLLLPWKEFLDIDTLNISCDLLRSIDVSSFL